MAGGLNRNITVRLLADTSKFTAGMAKVSAEAEKTSTTMEASGGKTKLLTTGIAAAGIAATALGVAAVRMAADFDAGMSTVQANTGASADEMSLLRQAAIDAGADTVYSATDASRCDQRAWQGRHEHVGHPLRRPERRTRPRRVRRHGSRRSRRTHELRHASSTSPEPTPPHRRRLAAGAGKAQGSARDPATPSNSQAWSPTASASAWKRPSAPSPASPTPA